MRVAVRNITTVKFGLQRLLEMLFESGVCVMESYMVVDCTANVWEVLVISCDH
jgi:hypothetical protein